MVRGHGYVKSERDLEQVVLKTNNMGTLSCFGMSPESREVLKFAGSGRPGWPGRRCRGIIVMRHSENADKVIKRVKEKLQEIEPSLPKG